MTTEQSSIADEIRRLRAELHELARELPRSSEDQREDLLEEMWVLSNHIATLRDRQPVGERT